MDTINLYAGDAASGEPVYENLPVLPLSDDRYRLLASPGLVMGVTKDDEIQFLPETGDFELLSRGQNLCIQVFLPREPVAEIETLITRVVHNLAGSHDGQTEQQLVFSVPIETGFAAVEQVLNGYVADNPGCEWYYGNVYDKEDGVTPLNWWCNG